MAGITIDIGDAVRALGNLGGQLRFATSKAMNGMMYESQARLRKQLPQHFTIRRRAFIEQSIKVIPSNKNDLRGEIGVYPRPNSSIDQALAAQELGLDRPGRTGRRLAEPLSGARPTPSAITTPAMWPGHLKRAFKITDKRGDILILQRVGSGKRRGHRAMIGPVQAGHDPNIRVMYRLVQRVHLKKRWNFVDTVFATHKELFNERLARELANALATAR